MKRSDETHALLEKVVMERDALKKEIKALKEEIKNLKENEKQILRERETRWSMELGGGRMF